MRRQVFKVAATADEDRPVTLIEGLDDAVADRLAEAGIWQIQHLATANPVEVGLRTLYPFPRVLDWIDQAMLISCIGTKVAAFRNLGVRGAIDLAALYGDFAKLLVDPERPRGRQQRASEIFSHLARDSSLSSEEIENDGKNLYEDRLVKTIWLYWQNQ